jgi:hypothetical protein
MSICQEQIGYTKYMKKLKGLEKKEAERWIAEACKPPVCKPAVAA